MAALEPDARGDPPRGWRLTLKYSAASLCGFAVDLSLLKLLTHFGISPAWARAASLFSAMQATFLINGFIVFRRIEPKRIHRQWAAYMLTNGFGNFCNYLTFTTLLSLHEPVVSNHVVAVCAGAFLAWCLNFACARLLVFNPRLREGIEALAGACGIGLGARRDKNGRLARCGGDDHKGNRP